MPAMHASDQSGENTAESGRAIALVARGVRMVALHLIDDFNDGAVYLTDSFLFPEIVS